jgi:hypothetical protein
MLVQVSGISYKLMTIGVPSGVADYSGEGGMGLAQSGHKFGEKDEA